ncbi:MAG TPA: sulfatase-like hydrolase/transferase [Polyangiaceae bacterium]|nr:sulfatase-like hydrolase/transferase [Polyangiaceae bacterium]
MIRRLGLSVLAAQAFAAAEVVLVLVLEHRRVASIWEGDVGLSLLVPMLLAGGLVLGAAGAALDALFADARRPARSLLAALAGVAGFGAGFGVGGGRHLATAATRGGFALLVAVTAAAAAFFAAPTLRRLRERRPGEFAALGAAAVVLAEVVNARVLVRLYPAFHWALTLFALVVAPLVVLAVAELLDAPNAPDAPNAASPGADSKRTAPAPSRGLGWLAPVVLGALAALFVPATARRLSHFDNFRFILLESAPIGGHAVELLARIAPPPAEVAPCDDAARCVEDGAKGSGERTLDLRDRDILLVSIDALRADHVGAYGYARPTTPNIDRLAQGGARFEAAYTATPHTSYAVTSLMTGKYMRPLLLQGMGLDSDTWAGLLRTYGYRTAAFYPPAVFFIDAPRFEKFKASALDFEYRWVEFAEGDQRVGQVERYLKDAPANLRLFTWVHLFGPHEPYENHPEHPFGDRDIDRYDSEIADADATFGRIRDAFLAARPHAVIILTADHGEEFGEHGGRYHGSSVYEEQVRVPLVVWAPGAIAPAKIAEPVQLIDLLPTVLSALDIPRPPRLRGRDLGPLLAGRAQPGAGFAYAETDDQALLAQGTERLVCARHVGACQLFDLATDPGETHDLGPAHASERDALREKLREIGASHGRYELGGLRAEGKGWPPAIRRALAGDGDAADEVAELLDDADVGVRRKAAEVLFDLRKPATAPALRLALGREEDAEARAWAALALTRLGQGAPLVAELLDGNDVRFRRLAALALGEAGDKRGENVLVEWWLAPNARDFERSREILKVLGELKPKAALGPLVQSLNDVRLRPYVARTLAALGDDAAIGPLLKAFADERMQSTRVALAEALVALGAHEELAPPLRRFLGVPDPLPGGLGLAEKAKILEHVGGPKPRELAKLDQHADLGQAVEVVVPPGGNGRGIRVIVRAKSSGAVPGEVVVSSGTHLIRFDRDGTPRRQHGVPALDEHRLVRLSVPPSDTPVEVAAPVPRELGLRPGSSVEVVVYASTGVSLEAIAFLPLADELPPPPPAPWKPGDAP